ncbi:MAG: hypothetical protein FWE42_02445, partial [Defluviitaleaceae bacterium]|nr:hypothetical protein [Defluviitaleaceae bacterium]
FVRGWVWRLLRARSPIATRIAVVAITATFLAFGSFSMVQLRFEGITRNFYESIEDPTAIDASEMNLMSRLVITRSQNAGNPSAILSNRIDEAIFAPIGASVFGLLLLGIDYVLSKKFGKDEQFKSYLYKPQIENIDPQESGDMTNGRLKQFFTSLTGPWNGAVMSLALTVIFVSLMINIANSVVLWFVWPGWRDLPFIFIWLPRAAISLLNGVANVFIIALLMGVCYKQPHIKAMIE